MLVEIGPCEEGKWVHDDNVRAAIPDEASENSGEDKASADEENDCTMCVDVETATDTRSSDHLQIDKADSHCGTYNRSVNSSGYAANPIAVGLGCDTHHYPAGDLCVAGSETECICDAGGRYSSKAPGDSQIAAVKTATSLLDDTCSSRDIENGCLSNVAGAEHPASIAVGGLPNNSDDSHALSEDAGNPAKMASGCSVDNGDPLCNPAGKSCVAISVGSSRLSMKAGCNVHGAAVGSYLAGPFGDCNGTDAADGFRRATGCRDGILPSASDGSAPAVRIGNGCTTTNHCVLMVPSCLCRSGSCDHRSQSPSHITRTGDAPLLVSNYVFQARRHPGGSLENFRIINSKLPPNSVEKSGGCRVRLEIKSDGFSTRFRRLDGDCSGHPSDLPPGFPFSSDVGIDRKSVCNISSNDGRLMVTPNISTDVPVPATRLPSAAKPSTALTTSATQNTTDGVVTVASPANQTAVRAVSRQNHRSLISPRAKNRIVGNPYGSMPSNTHKTAKTAGSATGNSTAKFGILLLQPYVLQTVDVAASNPHTQTVRAFQDSSPQLPDPAGPPQGLHDHQSVLGLRVGDSNPVLSSPGHTVDREVCTSKDAVSRSESALGGHDGDRRRMPQSDWHEKNFQGRGSDCKKPDVQSLPDRHEQNVNQGEANPLHAQDKQVHDGDRMQANKQKLPEYVLDRKSRQPSSLPERNRQDHCQKDHRDRDRKRLQLHPRPRPHLQVRDRKHSRQPDDRTVPDHKDSDRNRTKANPQPSLEHDDCHKARHDLNRQESRLNSKLLQRRPAPDQNPVDTGKLTDARSIQDEPIQDLDQDLSKGIAEAATPVGKWCSCCHLRFCPRKIY